MDINLNLVFFATLGVALICILSTYIIHSRILRSEEATAKKVDESTNQLRDGLQELTDLVKEKLVALEKSSVDSSNAQKQVTREKATELENLITRFHSDLTTAQKEQVGMVVESAQRTEALIKDTKSEMTQELNRGFETSLKCEEQNQSTLLSNLNNVETSITKLLSEQTKEQRKIAFDTNQKQLSNFENLSSILQSIRVDNLIELTNELAKHKDLTVESEDFVKKLGDCKVLTIEDKFTGQITNVFYENGIKRSTDTFSGEHLKYQMYFDDAGKPQKGVEFDLDGNVIFEYLYDGAGEVQSRVEHVRNEHGTVEKVEKSY